MRIHARELRTEPIECGALRQIQLDQRASTDETDDFVARAIRWGTDRLEEQRSAHGIIRSFNVHSKEINDKPKVRDRIDHLIANGDAFVARKEALTELIGEDECTFAVEELKHLLGCKGHHSRKRVQGPLLWRN